jgi:hypothetical protein
MNVKSRRGLRRLFRNKRLQEPIICRGVFTGGETSEKVIKEDITMHIRSKILSGAVVSVLFAAAPVLAQSSSPSTSPTSGAAPSASTDTMSSPAQTDSSAMMSKKMPMHKVHHRMSKKIASVDTSAEDATTAQLNQQQMSSPGATAAPSGSMATGNAMGTSAPADTSTKPDAGTATPH